MHPHDEAYLIMMTKLFDVLLDSVCWYFIEDFCINVHCRYWPVVFFFSWDPVLKMIWEGFPLFGLFEIVLEGMVPAPLCVSGRIRL